MLLLYCRYCDIMLSVWSFGTSCYCREDVMLGHRFDPEFIYFLEIAKNWNVGCCFLLLFAFPHFSFMCH